LCNKHVYKYLIKPALFLFKVSTLLLQKYTKKTILARNHRKKEEKDDIETDGWHLKADG